ncbi:DUF4838 domain-containing protein [Parapedobacter sp.]
MLRPFYYFGCIGWFIVGWLNSVSATGFPQRNLTGITDPWSSHAAKEPLVLAAQGKSPYSIVISDTTSFIEKKAATEFQRLFALGTGIDLPIVWERPSKGSFEILIGRATKKYLEEGADSILGAEGFLIKSKSDLLLINGGGGKGVLYGVYSFFEKYLGYRCYSPDVFKFPTLTDIKFEQPIDDWEVPKNKYRNVYYYVAMDDFYRDWHRLHNMEPDWGLWVHTFRTLVPPETYFAEHPAYFALVDGHRTAYQQDGHLGAQLCLSNPDVLQVVVGELKERMADNPEATYWSVSQNDTYPEKGYQCECGACAAIDEYTGSPSGSLVTFANKVAAYFPETNISTLAYRYSRSAPEHLTPAPNVNIMLCTIESDRHIPVASDSTNDTFTQDFEDWGKLTGNILMWDYVVQFANLMAPFPNLDVLQPNIQYFTDNHVNAHFQQGNISKGGEFSELKPYLIAKLLWNPEIDLEREITDFLHGYYASAAPYIHEYIRLTHEELKKSNLPLTIYGNPTDHLEGFLSPELWDRYDALFRFAEKAVSSDSVVLNRVKLARLPLSYALFESAKKLGLQEHRAFARRNDRWVVKPEMQERMDEFLLLCEKNQIVRLREGGVKPADYIHELKEVLVNTCTY